MKKQCCSGCGWLMEVNYVNVGSSEVMVNK